MFLLISPRKSLLKLAEETPFVFLRVRLRSDVGPTRGINQKRPRGSIKGCRLGVQPQADHDLPGRTILRKLTKYRQASQAWRQLNERANAQDNCDDQDSRFGLMGR